MSKAPIYHSLPMAEYIEAKAFSASLAQDIIDKSPFHAWYNSPWNTERVSSESNEADIGTYSHAMLLEGGHDALVVVDAADWRTNAAKEQREAARQQGKLAILAQKVNDAEAMVKEARAFIAASEISHVFDNGKAEQTIFWTEGGVECKIRPDWLTDDATIYLSYKTTAGSANPESWMRTQLPGYQVGMALYEQGIKAAFGVDTLAVHLVQEQKAPYKCSLVGLSPAYHEIAWLKLATALRIWKSCLSSGKFDAYPNRICYAEPAAWQMTQAEQEEINGIAYDPDILWGRK